MNVIDLKPGGSPFDEALRQIAEWQQRYPGAVQILLVLDGGEDVRITAAGPPTRATAVAGLFLAAANKVLED